MLHLRTLNPYLHSALNTAGSSLLTQVPRQSLPWSTAYEGAGRLVGGVSSFAFMGTNGHALVAGPATTAAANGIAAGGVEFGSGGGNARSCWAAIVVTLTETG